MTDSSTSTRMDFDYGQLQYRLNTVLAKDKLLDPDIDYHTETARLLTEKPVSKEIRKKANRLPYLPGVTPIDVNKLFGKGNDGCI